MAPNTFLDKFHIPQSDTQAFISGSSQWVEVLESGFSSVVLGQVHGPLVSLKVGTKDVLICLEFPLGCTSQLQLETSPSQGLKLPSTVWLF